MIKVVTSEKFERVLNKVDKSLKLQVDKQIDKIMTDPEVGKPMMYDRKGTRELYVGPFRISYFFDLKEKVLYLLDFYHKDEQ